MTKHRLFWPIALLLGLLASNFFLPLDREGVFSTKFFELKYREGRFYGPVMEILRVGAPLAIVALGMTLVIATKGIDLSVGSIVAVSGAVAAKVLTSADNPDTASAVATAMVAGVIVGIILGIFNGFLVSVVGVQPIIATLILLVAGRGIAQLITAGQILTFTSEPFGEIANGALFTIPIGILIVATLYTATWLLTRRTALGLMIESVGGNPEASRLAGLRSRAIIWSVYAFSGFCAGLAGLFPASDISGADANTAGLNVELDAILAVVIGGTLLTGGRFWLSGTLIGAFFITSLTTTILAIGVAAPRIMLVKAVVVTIVFLLQSPKFRAKIGIGRGKPRSPASASNAPGIDDKKVVTA